MFGLVIKAKAIMVWRLDDNFPACPSHPLLICAMQRASPFTPHSSWSLKGHSCVMVEAFTVPHANKGMNDSGTSTASGATSDEEFVLLIQSCRGYLLLPHYSL